MQSFLIQMLPILLGIFFVWLSNSTALSEVGAIVEENVRILPKGRFIGELEESLASPHSSSHKSNNCGKYVEVDSSWKR